MSKFVKILKLNKLTSEQKERLYKRLLHSSKWKCELDLFANGKKYCTSDVVFYNNDLSVLDFCYNFYYRTNKAIKHERYKNFSVAITQLKRVIKNQFLIDAKATTSNLRIYYANKANSIKKHVFSIEL